jgi:hypothetical protein
MKVEGQGAKNGVHEEYWTSYYYYTIQFVLTLVFLLYINRDGGSGDVSRTLKFGLILEYLILWGIDTLVVQRRLQYSLGKEIAGVVSNSCTADTLPH